MILADKIIQLRKKNGWSQEELAEKLGVSRQAVSKWEGAQATPDLTKLLSMSQLFGVTTDYLIKDEIETEEYAQGDESSALRRVTLKEAGDYIVWREKASLLIAGGVLLCVLGVIALLLLGAATQYASLGISEALGGGLGVGLLLLFAAAAVILFVYCGHRNAPYEFLERDEFETEYGVEGMVQKRLQEGQKTHMILLCAGIALCVIAPIPLIVGAFMADFDQALMLCPTLLLAGVGAALCIVAGVRRASLDQLLQQGDYSARNKRSSRLTGPLSAAYWMLVTAVFLAWSFWGNHWDISWVIWPVAGVLYAALVPLFRVMAERKER
ncbi:MAG: helix-turn-helix transcriptional regulator [Clostridia bacterium]|nr:helix-turn-helix transcriptional regulator [Clostridia bacterium]